MERRARASAKADGSPQSMQTTQQSNEARIAIEPGFAWDEQEAYLFDIDGTLLRSRDRVHFESFAASVRRVTGFDVTLAGVAIHGSTDTAILREACGQAGIPTDVFEPQVAAILEGMCLNVAKRRNEMDLVLMPGVKDALNHLARRGALLGLATGNLEMIGWIKIEEAGLDRKSVV
jgi:phosphoglycolate phosphatase